MIFRYPFDWKNPIGYSIAIALTLYLMLKIVDHVRFLLSFSIAATVFIITIVKDLICKLNEVNENLKAKQNRCQIIEKIIEPIRFMFRLKKYESNRALLHRNL